MDTIGILTLGQSPRPDFEAIFRRHLPDARLIVRGGLDGVPPEAIGELAAAGGDYPLFTLLRDGTSREIPLHRLKPLLDARAGELAAAGASVTALMCAGDFPDLESPIPIVYPSRVLTAVVGSLCRGKRIGVVTPNAGQVGSATAHWRRAGFHPTVVVASPLDPGALPGAAQALSAPDLELVVLDCMGFPPQDARRMRGLCGRSVLCAQSLVPRIMAEMLSA